MILDGAIRRFSHFSIQKTTMNEIAEDLSMSKPNLYYYFPDKPSLVLAVSEKITSEYLEVIRQEFESNVVIEESLLNMIRIRNSFFMSYYMLHISDGNAEVIFKDVVLKNLMEGVKEKVFRLLAAQIQKGIEQKIFRDVDPEKTAVLFIDMLVGLQLCLVSLKNPVPSAEVFDESLKKQLELTQIFLDGIRRNNL
jgi:TetR/AcrR family transcriptional repressor of mexJK operon